jgi:hypothetical protein
MANVVENQVAFSLKSLYDILELHTAHVPGAVEQHQVGPSPRLFQACADKILGDIRKVCLAVI